MGIFLEFREKPNETNFKGIRNAFPLILQLFFSFFVPREAIVNFISFAWILHFWLIWLHSVYQPCFARMTTTITNLWTASSRSFTVGRMGDCHRVCGTDTWYRIPLPDLEILKRYTVIFICLPKLYWANLKVFQNVLILTIFLLVSLQYSSLKHIISTEVSVGTPVKIFSFSL